MPRRQFPKAPTEARALILRAHPNEMSFNNALADAWQLGAQKRIEVDNIDVSSLKFDLQHHPTQARELEDDLLKVQKAIEGASHLVVAFPLWWGSTPATLKALFDRAFQPGWAYAYEEGKALPTPGLSGRSARVLVTMDAPALFDTLVYYKCARRQVARATLGFCGFKPVRTSTFSSVRDSTSEKRKKMLARAEAAGEKDALNTLAPFSKRRSAL